MSVATTLQNLRDATTAPDPHGQWLRLVADIATERITDVEVIQTEIQRFGKTPDDLAGAIRRYEALLDQVARARQTPVTARRVRDLEAAVDAATREAADLAEAVRSIQQRIQDAVDRQQRGRRELAIEQAALQDQRADLLAIQHPDAIPQLPDDLRDLVTHLVVADQRVQDLDHEADRLHLTVQRARYGTDEYDKAVERHALVAQQLAAARSERDAARQALYEAL